LITLKSQNEIELIRESGELVARVLEEIRNRIEPGLTTDDIDRLAREIVEKHDSAKPAFLGYRGFPKSICISLNNEVVHGIPSPRKKIKEGDVVSLDFGVVMNGYYADAALTLQVPPESTEVKMFLATCSDALEAGIRNAVPGKRIGDISSAIQKTVEGAGFSVVKSLVGHGIGRNLHEEPQIPNYGNPGEGILLMEGMVLAIEPMINMGTSDVNTLADEWTIVTGDGDLSAHFEHTVVVSRGGSRILTVSREKALRS
jgi:methionyl aminopeptidase